MSKSYPGTQPQPNRLINEKSPYLLQHAFNPVNWYSWDDQAFEKAARENKPVFLSIGYSTCHWCHVMAKESFENDAIAAILNESFVSVKVDREERPDIDQIYMLATQAMTGGGGWPMSVFLFPDKKPFYAGTYFPPEPRYNHPGFAELLRSISKAWADNKAALADSATRITDYLQQSSIVEAVEDLPSSWSDTGFKALEESYDSRYHGFGSGNKFPRPVSLDFLHYYYHRTGNTAALQMAEKTLLAMARGGMYDHLGGGFHRYAVDSQWRIPHFEKMLYDQAQLAVTYLHMYQETANMAYADVARETLDYALRDMQHPEGGLYSAEDADSDNPYNEDEHGEGAFYLWKESEIRDLLDDAAAEIFIASYGCKKEGNALQDPAHEFTGRNILYRAKTTAEVAQLLQRDLDEIRVSLHNSRTILLEKRNTRKKPHKDDKIITAWNALMLSALAKGGQILNTTRYLDEGKRVAGFIFNHLFAQGDLKRRWRDGEARFDAVLEDYAFLIQGLLDLYSATHDNHLLERAVLLLEKQLELFHDPAGGFYTTSINTDLITRIKESYDGAEPSGNSVAALNCIRLGRLLHAPQWLSIGLETIKTFGRILASHGSAMPLLLCALELYLLPEKQVVIAGERSSAKTEALLQQAHTFFDPALQVLLADGAGNQEYLSRHLGYLRELKIKNGNAAAYLCRDQSCGLPVGSPEQLALLLRR